jgi:hypothetical protein
MRDYALLTVVLTTGRHSSELVGMRSQHITIVGKREPYITLTFVRCKGNKVMKDTLTEKRLLSCWNTCMRSMASSFLLFQCFQHKM